MHRSIAEAEWLPRLSKINSVAWAKSSRERFARLRFFVSAKFDALESFAHMCTKYPIKFLGLQCVSGFILRLQIQPFPCYNYVCDNRRSSADG
jgi:hypothetical protein